MSMTLASPCRICRAAAWIIVVGGCGAAAAKEVSASAIAAKISLKVARSLVLPREQWASINFAAPDTIKGCKSACNNTIRMGIDDCRAHFYLLHALPDELKAAKMSGAPPKSIHVMRAINHATPALFISDNNITDALSDRPFASGLTLLVWMCVCICIKARTALFCIMYAKCFLHACVRRGPIFNEQLGQIYNYTCDARCRWGKLSDTLRFFHFTEQVAVFSLLLVMRNVMNHEHIYSV